MSDSDKYPTVRQVLDGEAPFPSDGYNDPETGTFTVPEQADAPDMIKDADSGLWLPKPKHKKLTRLFFSSGLVLDVSETVSEVREAMKGTGDMELTGPVYSDEPVIVMRSHVKDIIGLTEDYRDLEEIEVALKQREWQKRMAKSQVNGGVTPVQAGAVLPFPQHGKGKRR